MRTFRLLALLTVLVAVASCGSTSALVDSDPSVAVAPTTVVSIPRDPPLKEVTAEELDAAYLPGCWVGRTEFHDLYGSGEGSGLDYEGAFVDIHADGSVETNMGSYRSTTCEGGVLFPENERTRLVEQERREAIERGDDMADWYPTQWGPEIVMNVGPEYAFLRRSREYNGDLSVSTSHNGVEIPETRKWVEDTYTHYGSE
jgi:hypothetical protein